MNGFIDLHSHILPALDDGARDINETKEMLRVAYEEGIREIIVTPHFFASEKSASAKRIKDTIAMVQDEMKQWGFSIKFYPGNEIFYHSEVAELLDAGDICTLAGSEYVLVEFDPMTEYSYLRDGILKLDSYGYIPILAHAERYECLFRKKERLQRVKDHGGLIQVNASSFQRSIFDEIGKRARYIMKNELLDFIGTDAHSTGKRSPRMQATVSYLYRKLGNKRAAKILVENPRAVLENQRIL